MTETTWEGGLNQNLETMNRTITQYLADNDGQTLLGALLLYGYTSKEIDDAEARGDIIVLDEGVVYLPKYRLTDEV